MKKNVLIAGTVLVAMVTAAGAVNAAPSTHSIYLNGLPVAVEGYAIDGNNYFKLRDLAKILAGTNKEFEVSWNNVAKRIDLTTSKAYTAVGGELAAIDAGKQEAKEFEVSWNNVAKRIDLTTSKAYTAVGGELAAIDAGKQEAKASNAVVYKDGALENYKGYTINENNYYMLRDIADSMGIDIEWDGTTKRVDILTNQTDDKQDVTDQPAEPSAPDDSSASTGDTEEYEILYDYRQAGDPGIRSVNLSGSSGIPSYCFFPSYGKYSAAYQNLLDTCGEEIISKTIHYYTYCGQTQEEDILCGFPMVITVADKRVNAEKWWPVTMVYIDSGKGSFELKMPKSLYEKTLSGEQVLHVEGAITEADGRRTVINGKTYEINSNPITASDVRDNRPTTMRLNMTYKKPGT